MGRRPVMTVLILIIAMMLTLPMRAQQKHVAPTLRSACVCSGALRAPTTVIDRRYNTRSADLKVSATTPGISLRSADLRR